ncbi:MAG TPA: type II toxin-antitoxin system VapC family toxin [Albitalea sp.]|nr:type II toxin-antitoxin system VapC family toxin [Albitalea sp.]
MSVYIDTSAFIKRYVNEATSERLDEFLASVEEDLVISPLGLTEFESMLQRRLRQRDFDQDYLDRTRDLLGRDIESAVWSIQPFDPNIIPHATRLIRELKTPLATLDAIHLASAQAYGCKSLATGDRHVGRAAELCGLVVHDFSI